MSYIPTGKESSGTVCITRIPARELDYNIISISNFVIDSETDTDIYCLDANVSS